MLVQLAVRNEAPPPSITSPMQCGHKKGSEWQKTRTRLLVGRSPDLFGLAELSWGATALSDADLDEATCVQEEGHAWPEVVADGAAGKIRIGAPDRRTAAQLITRA